MAELLLTINVSSAGPEGTQRCRAPWNSRFLGTGKCAKRSVVLVIRDTVLVRGVDTKIRYDTIR